MHSFKHAKHWFVFFSILDLVFVLESDEVLVELNVVEEVSTGMHLDFHAKHVFKTFIRFLNTTNLNVTETSLFQETFKIAIVSKGVGEVRPFDVIRFGILEARVEGGGEDTSILEDTK